MAYGILAEDMLAICLLFAGGDVMTPMGEVICRVEEFQRDRRYFGASDLDFRWAFMHLAEGASKGKKTRQEVWCQGDDPRIIFSGLLLRDFIEPVVRKSGIWFNNESQYWADEREYPPSPRNLLMRRFLSRPENRKPEKVIAFLYENGWDDQLLDDARIPYQYHRYDEWRFGEPEPLEGEMKDFADFLDSPFYKEMMERKQEREKKEYLPYR